MKLIISFQLGQDEIIIWRTSISEGDFARLTDVVRKESKSLQSIFSSTADDELAAIIIFFRNVILKRQRAQTVGLLRRALITGKGNVDTDIRRKAA